MANNNPTNSMRFRVKIIMTAVFMVLFGAVAANFFKISVIDNKIYQEKANDQHFGSITISAHRGSIYDAKGTPMAKSATVYKVFLDPTRFREDIKLLEKKIDKRNSDKQNGSYVPQYDEKGNEINPLPQSVEEFKQEAVALISGKLGITPEKVTSAMEENTQYSVLQDQVEKPVADELLAYFNKYGFISLAVVEDTKRYYPQNEVAASVIGFTNADGDGLYGIEAYYDEYLAGVDGRTISAKDSNGNELPYRYSKTYEPKNGDDVYLTIDSNIQYMLEKHLEEMNKKFEVAKRSCAILMDAKTGAVYGMATYPGFDLNEPYTIFDPVAEAEVKAVKDEKERKVKMSEALERQWCNKCITENYEPGSVFKVVTSASAIEDGLIDFTKREFYCSGVVTFPGANPIHCHQEGGHNMQTFQEALTHSCNPAFIEIGRRLGIDRFCYYFDAFGLRERTGVDLPAEIKGNNYTAQDMKEIDLVSSAYGQCSTVTPIEMLTAYCAAINGGYLLTPYVVDKVVDEAGNIVLKNERTVKRQVISEETSQKMRSALKQVVDDNNGGNVAIKGYSIGGKSGTSQRLSITSAGSGILSAEEEAKRNQYASSYVCFTPAEDPELILLVMADFPNKNIEYYGSKVAVPTAREILTDVLPYLGMTPNYSDKELEDLDVKVPLLEGSIDSAKKTLDDLGLTYEIIGKGVEVVSQSPITGTAVAKGGCVYLYTEIGIEAEVTKVPDLTGLSPEYAKSSLEYCGLNFVARGASHDNAYVTGQSFEKDTEVPKGTAIVVEFTVNETSD